MWCSMSNMVPELDQQSGHLPPGRYRATLNEVEALFVSDERFLFSATRKDVWEGFLDYTVAWADVERELGVQLVHVWWLGGSFISGEQHPGDLDVTPVLDSDALSACAGKEGMGRVKMLMGDRERLRRTFKVEPFPLKWSAVPCTLFPGKLSESAHAAMALRGGLDAWWQRVRPAGGKVAPVEPEAFAERGYLEVER